MAFDAKVYKVLIASPADVIEERMASIDVIHRWNRENAEKEKIVLMPMLWEICFGPLVGHRPQDILNKQFINNCDMLIGIFWTRLGSPTGGSKSGTVEEIELFIKKKRPVMLYFSSQAVKPNVIEGDQLDKLITFRNKIEAQGLVEEYSDISEFKENLFHQLSPVLPWLSTEKEFISVQAEKEYEEHTKSNRKIVKKGGFYMEDYKKDGVVRSFLLKGDTRNIRSGLKKRGGKWNQSLGGWIFPKSKEFEIVEYLKEVESALYI